MSTEYYDLKEPWGNAALEASTDRYRLTLWDHDGGARRNRFESIRIASWRFGCCRVRPRAQRLAHQLRPELPCGLPLTPCERLRGCKDVIVDIERSAHWVSSPV